MHTDTTERQTIPITYAAPTPEFLRRRLVQLERARESMRLEAAKIYALLNEQP